MSATPDPPGTPAATAPRASTPAPADPGDLRLRFTGSAAEYFRIWIVNTCLTLLTVGIFSAWAKVRKKRYFYSHTQLDGTPFQYLAQPIPILKGRIIATAVFGFWYLGTHFFVEMLPLVFILVLILAPWVLVRSAAFNARYSAFRNMTFSFAGSYWSAVKVLYGWGLLVVLTFGFAFSWWQQRIKRYLVTRMSYGDVAGEFSARGGQFFRTYFIAGLLFGVAIIALTAVATPLFVAAGGGRKTYLIAFVVCIYALYAAMFAYIQAHITNLVWNHTQLGPITFRSTLRARELLGLYVTNALAILASAGMLIPWATIRTLKYRLGHMAVSANGAIDTFRGSDTSTVRAAGAEIGEFFDFDMSL